MTLKLNGSSSGYTAIDAPTAAGSNTLVLPANNGTAGQILQTDGNGTLTWVDKPSSGLSHASIWRLTGDKTGSTDYNPLTGWEETDQTGEGVLGASMTESSGIFTFPATGYWQITANILVSKNNATWRYCAIGIHHTRDASAGSPTWTDMAHTLQGGAAGGGQTYGAASTSCILDITDVSEQKVRFRAEADTTHPTWYSDTALNQSHFTFLKLGDT